MLYISLILIAAGIFFIIYTLLIKTKKQAELSGLKKSSRQAASVLYNEQPGKDGDKSSEKIESDKSINNQKKLSEDIVVDKEVACELIQAENKADSAEPESFDIAPKESANTSGYDIPEKKLPGIFSAALYEDSSEIIDYDNNDSAIDLTFNEYKKIRRICAGDIEIAKDGINFRAGKKIFRFDFHQVANMKTGSNYIALFLKKSNTSRLFLFNMNFNFGAAAKQAYNNYTKNVFHI
jgi:hypothetical protein